MNALNAPPRFLISFAVRRISTRNEPSFRAQPAVANALFGAAAGMAAVIAWTCAATSLSPNFAMSGSTTSRANA